MGNVVAAHLDGLARVPGHRASHQLAVEVPHVAAALLLPAGGRGGDLGALRQVEVGRVEAVAVDAAARQLLRRCEAAAGRHAQAQ